MGKLSIVLKVRPLTLGISSICYHAGQVSGVAFDSYWSVPNSDGTGENVMYRFGSVGQVKYNSVNYYTKATTILMI